MAPRSPIESQLVEWASVNLPAAVSAIQQLPHDQAWRARCVAAIVRARADADVAWLFAAVEGPHWQYLTGIPVGRAAGYPVCGSFSQWVADVRAVAGVGEPPASPDIELPTVHVDVPPRAVERPRAATLFAA